VILDEMQARLQWTPLCVDGQRVEAGDRVAQISGSARDLLVCERMLLNFLGRLSGVATTTRRFVEATAGAKAEIYDTRKTTPGWRLLEKYAVSQGGGRNHRRGLYDAVLIKDNHLALWRETEPDGSPAGAVLKAKAFVERAELPRGERPPGDRPPIEVEVDTLAQLVDVLAAGPDLVLLDNMSLDELRRAVALRDAAGDRPLLEASGGITLDRVGAVAATGVDRISVGGLTHSAVGVDFGLDWL
jgi:nicotinate-nucleotide pyrophosphorylase (carboxylating)